ncbi:hypothetical protein RB195_012073 [Necator americanus]|uniref:Uncharacterized protein n=1 Tax=Necator americanus TaxID=51031 RepID=A0ABR1D5D3_NECAM
MKAFLVILLLLAVDVMSNNQGTENVPDFNLMMRKAIDPKKQKFLPFLGLAMVGSAVGMGLLNLWRG